MENAGTELEVFLLQRTGKGDRGSFEQLYERFSGVIFSTALQVLGNQESAEDVLQEVFVAIWEKAPMYDSERGKPITWALTLARNKAIDRLRSQQRKGALQDRIEQEAEISEPQQSSSDEVEAAEKSKLVRDALLHLSDSQREAIDLAYFAGLSQAEIACKLRKPLGTIKARIRRGLLRMREVLSGKAF
ncbi:MAG TPA: sigma-70 family RNA polymerase sigma factor [Chthoniobacteraceae bacterium]|jgi:RNA polymerase sigma-70 factor (ECF subfamily)|nr:sigma-70 family RNA polymerase sigma factor [Chthoniobacteraceae bacterium]